MAAPFVLSLWDGHLEFEATDETNQWSFNFRSPAVVKAGVWNHLAAVVEAGKGVILYCNGEAVAKLDNPKKRCTNAEPLVLGREAWNGGDDGQPLLLSRPDGRREDLGPAALGSGGPGRIRERPPGKVTAPNIPPFSRPYFPTTTWRRDTVGLHDFPGHEAFTVSTYRPAQPASPRLD